MDELNQKLQLAYEALQQKEKIVIHLADIEQRLTKKYALLKKLKVQIEKGEKDIEKLEKMNLRALFHSILGNKKEQLERERQEYLVAYLKFEGIEKEIDALLFEKDVLEKKLGQSHKAEQNYRQLIAIKSQKLKATNKKMAKEIFQVEARIWGHKSKIRELEISITRGESAIKALKKLIRGLKTVKKWNAYERKTDSFAKKKYINKAKDDLFLADIELEKLEEALNNIYQQHDLDYSKYVNAFQDFLEDFVDDLISDWIIKNKIENALNNIKHVKDKVSRILSMLAVEIEKSNTFLEAEEEEKRLLILKA